ncbi:MAG: YHS domain-containing (seleno)protein [Burkholderiaceae bacterium]
MPSTISLEPSRRGMLVALAALLVVGPARAEPPINTLKPGFFGGRTDTAINGYDPVAYFTVGKPVKGQDTLAYEWMGAKWKFSSQANLDLFKGNPEKYAPQYGGYCAYGVVQDALIKVEPEQFTVRDGKLYLNYDADIQAKWLKDPAGFIKQADAKFTTLLKK